MTLRVLFFAYYYPPSAGPGVRRSVRFVRDLAARGLEPIVITVDGRTFENREEFGVDEGGLQDIPAGVRVERVPAWSLPRLRHLLMRTKLMRLAMMALYPIFWERQALWVIPAIRRGLRLIRERRPDVVYTSTGPFCSNLIGLALRRLTGVPWVTDYRDLWTGSWLKWWPTRIHFEVEKALERVCLSTATRVIANTPTARDTLIREFPALDPTRVDVIPNGWDEPPASAPPDAPVEHGERIVLLHTGSFDAPPSEGPARNGSGTKQKLRDWSEYRRREYDLSTHSPVALFRALAMLRTARPDLADRLLVRLVGRVHPAWVRLAERLGVAAQVDFPGPKSFAESRRMQAEADVLLLTTVSRVDRGPVPRVNAKIYEYMRAGRPILVLSDPGDSARMAEEVGLGRVVSPRDPDAIRTVLQSLAEDRDSALRGLVPRADVIERYGAPALAERLIRTLDRAAGRRARNEAIRVGGPA